MKRLALLLLLLVAPLYADPIAVYLTWQRAPDTTMTIQWISMPVQQDDVVEYQRAGEKEWKSIKGAHVPLPGFLLHRVELTALHPDTDYLFKANGAQYRFRTMPSHPNALRFVVGGDVYHDSLDLVETMNREVATLDPQFILIGGDLVYNDKATTSTRWLDWLTCCSKQFVTRSGRLIPIVPAIGNHDVEKVPYFATLFPLPGSQGYGVLDFGKYLSVILLDTDHTHPIEGVQADWLKETLRQRHDVFHKLALYHVPAYPCVRDFHNEVSARVRKSWVPLFEEGGLHMAFENHDHAYKRTWPLLNGKPDPKGVLYLGDGGWGVKKARKPRAASKTWYLAKSLESRNALLVILNGKERHFLAFDDEGKILDEYFFY